MADAAAPAPADGGELTALVLNNQIVSMRPLVSQSRARCARHLVRRMRAVAKRNAKSDKERTCNERKVDRLAAELDALKHLRPDDVSKFALVNVKTADELVKSWSPCTAASVRSLQRAAGQPVLGGEVDRFRGKYAGQWPTAVPFLLQRLGLQYRDGSRPKRKGGEKRRLARAKGAKDDTGGTASAAESAGREQSAEPVEAPPPLADGPPVKKERAAQRRAKKRDAAVDELLTHLSAAAPNADAAKVRKKAGGKAKRAKERTPAPPPELMLDKEMVLPAAAGPAVIERLRLDGAGADYQSNAAVVADGGGQPVAGGDEEHDAFFAAASGSGDEDDGGGGGEKAALPLPPGQKRGSRGGAGRSKAAPREANKTPLGSRRRPHGELVSSKEPKRAHHQAVKDGAKPPQAVARAEEKGKPPAPAPAPAAPAAADPVHPSWEAKRAAREALKAAKPAGKKIVFGDD